MIIKDKNNNKRYKLILINFKLSFIFPFEFIGRAWNGNKEILWTLE